MLRFIRSIFIDSHRADVLARIARVKAELASLPPSARENWS